MFTTIDLDGRTVSFAPVVRPVIALASGSARGLALDLALCGHEDPRPAGAASARLSAYDLEQLDQWLLEAGLAAVQPDEARGALLFAPAAFATLVSARGRRAVVGLLSAARQRLGARLVIEVTHIDPGLPPSRLVEVLGAVAAVSKVAFARLRPERRVIAALSACGLAGAAVEAAGLADPEDAEALTRIRLVLRAIGPSLMIHNLRTVAAINAARAAGVTYASLDIAGVPAA